MGGGCFWCTEAIFLELRGVTGVEPGYSGGTVSNPTYGQVCDGDTGHAEVVMVTFDPSVIGYRQILEIFFTVHDPTTLNRQGYDEGTQYRSVIFYNDQRQKQIAEEAIKEVNDSGIWGKPVVTELVPRMPFFRAEDYHREYYRRNPRAGYCNVIITPKVLKFRKKYAEMLKPQAA